MKALRSAMNQAHDEFCFFDLQQCGNGMIVLIAHGLRNHRYEPVIDLFHWVAQNLPHSYGLLHIQDDELPGEDSDLKVWRLANARLTERNDPFLLHQDSMPEEEGDLD